MTGAHRSLGLANTIAALAVALTVALGVLLRLEDALANPVIPAEDPFTHMKLVREHVRTGTLEAVEGPAGTMYPPGMHGAVAALWIFSGVDLYALFRFAPAATAGIGVLGIALVLWRFAGRTAAFVGAMAFALAPEIIFRTAMMAPTALDLAMLPFLFYALLEVIGDELAWIGVAAPLAVFFVFAHPWVFGIVAAAGLLFALLAIGFPWPASRSPRLSSTGFAATLAIVGGGLGLVLSTCAGLCGPGFTGILPYGGLLKLVWPVVLVVSFLPVVLLAIRSEGASGILPDARDGLRPLWTRLAMSGGLAVLLVGLTVPAVQGGMPELVDLPAMIGWPLLALAAFAFVALPFLADRLAYLGASLAMVTYPAVIYNPLNSPFWPHRTAVYLGLGLVILAGVAGGALARWGRGLWHERVARPRPEGHLLSRPTVAIAPALIVAVSLGGTMFTATPTGYADGWYRLYEPCEMDAMEQISEKLEADPSATLVSADWRPAVVLSAITEDSSRVWAKEDFFSEERERKDLVAVMESKGQNLYVLEERYLRSDSPGLDGSFLQDDDWRAVDSWCAEEISPRYTVTLYEPRGGPR